MNRFLLSTPGFIITGIGCLAILWLVGKLLGASFFFIAAVVIVFLIALIAALENAVTKVNASAIISDVDICEVTAKAEQMPKTCKVMGLSLTSGVVNTFFVSSFKIALMILPL